MARQQAGQDDACTRCGQPAKRHRQPREGAEENIGKNQLIGRSGCDRARGSAGRANECKHGRGPIDLCVSARCLDRARIDIACRYAGTKESCRGNRQDPAAGADVEHAADPLALCKTSERLQAPARRAMATAASRPATARMPHSPLSAPEMRKLL